MKAVIALGANIGNPHAQIAQALTELSETFVVTAISTLIETEPVDAPGQPNYINGIALIETELAPLDVLRKLQTIEEKGGRVRTSKNAARTIDLDLISYGELFVDSADLTLPHPRAHQRFFVLAPWVEVDPDGILPGYGRVAELLRSVQ